MKKRICVLLILMFTGLGLFACGKDPYSQIKMTVSKNELTITMIEDSETKELVSEKERITVQVSVPKSISNAIVLPQPKNSKGYGDEYVSIQIEDANNGTYSLVFEGKKTGYTEIPIKTKEGNVTEIIAITVDIAVSGISFKPGKTILAQEGSTLDLTGRTKSLINFTPSITSQTRVRYYISTNNTKSELSLALDGKLKDNVLDLTNFKIDNTYLDNNGACVVYLFAVSLDSNGNEIDNVQTNNVLAVKIIKTFEFPTTGLMFVGTGQPGDERYSLTSRVQPTKGVNSLHYDLSFANPNIPIGEVTDDNQPAGVSEIIFGGRLGIAPQNNDFKISIDNVDSDIVEVNALPRQQVGQNYEYYFQVTPKRAGSETLVFKIDYTGGSVASAETSEFDGLFTKYIYLTINVKNITQQSNLKINDEPYSTDTTIMVFKDYATERGAKLKIFDSMAPDMEFKIATDGAIVSNADIVDETGAVLEANKFYPNGSVFYIKSKTESNALEFITITMTSKLYTEVSRGKEIQFSPSDGYTYSKSVKVGLQHLSSTVNFNNFKGKTFTIKNSNDLERKAILEFDTVIDARQIISEVSLSNSNSGRVTFGTGDEKNIIFFTPNFRLEKDFYVSSTNVTLTMVTGASSTAAMTVELDYVTDEDNKPLVVYQVDESNSSYFASWTRGEGKDANVLTVSGLGSNFKFDNNIYTYTDEENGRNYSFKFFDQMALATNAVIDFNIYRLFIFNGNIQLISVNDGIIVSSNNASVVSWQKQAGQIRTGSKVTTATENGDTLSGVLLTVQVPNGISEGNTIYQQYTIRTFVFEKITDARLKTNSFTIYDATNLKTADNPSSLATLNLAILTASGNSGKESVESYGDLAYGNLYQNYSMLNAEEVFARFKNTIEITNKSLMDDGVSLSKVSLTENGETKEYFSRVLGGGAVNWYNTVTDAVMSQNAIDDITLLGKLGQLARTTIYVFRAKFDRNKCNGNGTEDASAILSYAYGDGAITLSYLGTVKQFNNSFETNFSVKIYNPTKSRSLKTWVDKEMGLYLETDDTNLTVSTRYEVLPTNTFNKNIFVEIKSGGSNCVIKFTANGKTGYYTDVNEYLKGEIKYIEKTEGGKTVVTDLFGEEVNVAFEVEVKDGRIFFTYTGKDSTTGKLQPGKYICTVVPLDQVTDGISSASAYASEFNINVADGSEQYKYQIRNSTALENFLNNTRGVSDKYYQLATDIILNKEFVNPNFILQNNLSGLFEVTHDGKETDVYRYSIFGLRIRTTNQSAGLFAGVGIDDLLLDYVNIENASIVVETEKDVNVGILIAQTSKNLTIRSCKVSGSITINVKKVLDSTTIVNANVNVGAMIGKASGALTLQGAPSESTINNNNINANVSIQVILGKEVVEDDVHVINAGGLIGLAQATETKISGGQGIELIDGFTGVNIFDVNVISRITAVKITETGANVGKTQTTNYAKNVNIGGVIGRANYAKIDNVVVYPIIAGSTNVGGVIGQIGFGEITNTQVQLLYNLNMKNIIAAYNNVGGIVGSADLIAANIQSGWTTPLCIDYCYVRSYTSRAIKDFTDGYFDVVNDINEDYYGGVVLLNDQSEENRYMGGLVGAITYQDDDSVRYLVEITSSYFNSDLASNVNNARYEKVGGFVGYKKEEEVGTEVKLTLSLTDCYFDGDTLLGGNLKLIYGNLSSDSYIADNNKGVSFNNEAPTYVYSHIGSDKLSNNGDYTIWRETESSKQLVSISENYQQNVEISNIYAKIDGTLFGVTNKTNAAKDVVTYSGLTTKLVETNILVFRFNNGLRLSANRRELQSSPTGDNYSYYELEEPTGTTSEVSYFDTLNALPAGALHDMSGYGFITATDEGTTGGRKTNAIKNILKGGFTGDVNISTEDDLLTMLNEIRNRADSSLHEAIAAIECNKKLDNKSNSTLVKYSETLKPTIIGFGQATEATSQISYPVFEVKVGGVPYYINGFNTNILYSSYEYNNLSEVTTTNGETTINKNWYFSMPKFETKTYIRNNWYNESVDLTINGDKVNKVNRFTTTSGGTNLKAYRYDFYLYSGSKAYLFTDCVQYPTHDEYGDEFTENGVTYRYLYKLSDSSSDLNKYVYYPVDNFKVVYTHINPVEYGTVDGTQDAAIMYLFDDQAAFVIESANSTVSANGEVKITIKGVEYTLKNGSLVYNNGEEDVEFQQTPDSRFYVDNRLEVNSENKILSNEKILAIIKSINNKEYSSIQEMFEDLGFNNFDGEIYAPFETTYYFSGIEKDGENEIEVWYTDLVGVDQITDDALLVDLNNRDESELIGMEGTNDIFYYYDEANNVYYYLVGYTGAGEKTWYMGLTGTKVTDNNILKKLRVSTVKNFGGTGFSYTILATSFTTTINAVYENEKWYYDDPTTAEIDASSNEVKDAFLIEQLEENKTTSEDKVVSSYEFKLYKHFTDDGYEWTYDSGYENVVGDSYITSLIKDDEVYDVKPAFTFIYNQTTYNVTIESNKSIKIVAEDGRYFINALGSAGYQVDSFSIENGKLVVRATNKDGVEVEQIYSLQAAGDSYKWVVSDKVNNGLPVLVRLAITQTNTSQFDSGYELWFDTLATLSLTVHDFVADSDGYYEVVEGTQRQGHIMLNADTVVLMYNEPAINDENKYLNTYELSYGVTDNGYFVASLNGKVLEISGVKIDKSSASQIVITSSDSDVVSLDTVEQNVSDKTIKLTVNGEGETVLTFYNLKDDGINIKLYVKVVKGFTNFEIKPDGESSNGGLDKTVAITLQVGKAKDYNIGFVNVLNNMVYPANTSGYQIKVVSVDGNTSVVTESSSMLLGNVLVSGEMIGKTFDFSYAATLNILALNKLNSTTSDAGKITLQVIPFVLYAGEKIFVDELSKTVNITINTPALSIDFTEVESRLMAQDTKEISVVVTSNNGEGAQALILRITGVNDIVINDPTTINRLVNLVVDDGTTPSLLSLKFKSYVFTPGENVVGKTVINRHTFTFVAGLDMASYLKEYKNGVNPLYYDKEFEFVASDGTEESLTSEFKLTIAPNPVNSLESFFYPVKSEGADGNTKDEYSQNNIWAIVPGRSGMMKVEIAPEYNNVLAVELELDSRYLNYVDVRQYKPDYMREDESILDPDQGDYIIGYTPLDTANTVIGNRLVLWNTLVDYEQLQTGSSDNIDSEREDIYKTQGEYYVRFAFRDNMPQNSRFNVVINLYDRNRNVLLSETKEIFVERLPEINVTVDEKKSTIVGKGDDIKVNFDANNINSDIDWKIYTIHNGEKEETKELYTKNGNTYELVGASKIDASKDYYIKTSKLSYGSYTIEVNASNTINNTIYKASSSATFKVVKVAIASIREIDAVDGVVTINNGTTKTLKASITLNKYAEDVLKDSSASDYETIKNEYNSVVEQISNITSSRAYPISSNWGISMNNGWVQLGVSGTSDLENGVAYPGFIFLVDNETNKCKIRARVISNVQFKLSVQYYYDEDGQMHVVEPQTSPVYYDNETNTEYYLEILEYYFTLNIKDNSNEDHPNPINSQDELEAMQAGVNYILQRDIELSSWRPMDFTANYLDGNGFTITIKSFDLSNEKGKSEAYVGLFRTIAEGCTVKNLNINISDLLRSKTLVNAMIEEQILPNIDLRATEVVYFGCLSATNEGVVENVRVLNFNSQSDLILYVATTRGYYQVNDDYSMNTSYIGGLVGQNSGVIADSMLGVREGKTVTLSTYLNSKLSQKYQMVEGFGIWGGNNLAGVSAINNGTISNTYISRVSLKNTARVSQNSFTAGFVGQNSGKVYSCAATTIKSDLTNFRADSTKIESSVPTAGFVYKNLGKIEDCYSNIKIVNITISTAGFVYENEGDIINAYTTTKNNAADNTKSHGLFVYVKPMKGTLKNCYYAIVGDELGLGNVDMEILKVWDPAIGLNIMAEETISKSLFDGFTFASDEASLDGVWLYTDGSFPRLLNCESIELYSCRELTSAPTALFRINEVERVAYTYNEEFVQLETEALRIDNNTFSYSGIEITKIGDKWTYTEDNEVKELEIVTDTDGNIYYKYQSEISSQNGKDTMFNYTYTKYNPGSKNNPILVASAEEFARYIVSYSYEETIENTKYNIFGGSDDEDASKARYIKIVQDLDFSDKTISSKYSNETGSEISISDITFNGVLLGNSMSLSNIYLTRSDDLRENENWGIFAQVGLPTAHKTISRTNSNAFVFNLKLNYREVSSENSRKVGILAGTIQNATITKVDIVGPSDYKESDIVKGKYLVGGLAGYIGEGATITEITTKDVRVSSAYITTTGSESEAFNLTDKSVVSSTTFDNFKYTDDAQRSHESQVVLESNEKIVGLTESGSGFNTSYAGAIAGAIIGHSGNDFSTSEYNNFKSKGSDTSEESTYKDPTYKLVRNSKTTVQNVTVSGGLSVTAMVAGGMFGYAGGVEATRIDKTIIDNGVLVMKDMFLELTDDTEISQGIFGRAYSGGMVGYTYKTALIEARVEHAEDVQDTIDTRINTINSTGISRNDLFVSQLGNANDRNVAIGGIAGITKDAIIVDSLSKVNVTNEYSYIAGGIVGQANGSLYLAYDYTIGNVDAGLMIGGLIGYKTYAEGQKANDLYMFNCIALNVWDAKVKDYMTANKALFSGFAGNAMPEIGNQIPKDYEFGDTTSIDALKYLGSVIGRVSYLNQTESREANYNGSASAIKSASTSNIFKALNYGERVTDVAGAAFSEHHPTFYNDNIFHVVSSTYGRVIHTGDIAKDNYTSRISDDKFNLSAQVGVSVTKNSSGNITKDNIDLESNVIYERILGNQYYISQITGDYLNSTAEKETSGSAIPGNYNYKNEFSLNWGFVMDVSGITAENVSDVFGTAASGVSTSYVWYVESLKYLPKHGYNINSNVQIIENETQLKEALTFGYSDKIYKIRLESFVKKENDVVKVENGEVVFDMPNIEINRDDINLSNCVFVVDPYTATKEEVAGLSSTKTYNRFTITFKKQTSANADGIYNILSGCTFVNIDFVINTNDNDTVDTNSTGGYYGIFANELLGCTFTNSTFEINTSERILKDKIQVVGLLAGRVNRSVFSDTRINIGSGMIVIRPLINEINNVATNNVTHIGGVFGLVRDTTIDTVVANVQSVAFGKADNQIVNNSICFYSGGFAGKVEGGTISNLTLNLGTVYNNIKLNKVTTDKGGGINIGGVIGGVSQVVMTSVNVSNFSLNVGSIDTSVQHNNLKIGVFAGNMASSTITNLCVSGQINYTTKTFRSGDKLLAVAKNEHIGIIAGYASSNVLTKIKTYLDENGTITTSKIEYSTISGDITQSAEVQSAINIGAVIGSNEYNTLSYVESTTPITVNVGGYNNFCTTLRVGGIAGYALGSSTTLYNAMIMGNITLKGNYFKSGASVGGVYGQSGRAIMSDVTVYGDISYLDPADVKTLTLDGNTYYYNSNETLALNNVYIDINLTRTLVQQLNSSAYTDEKIGGKNLRVVVYGKNKFYGLNNSGSYTWYTRYYDNNTGITLASRIEGTSYKNITNDNFYIGGVIGSGSNATKSSEFTNVLAMANIVATNRNGDSLKHEKTYTRISGFMYNLKAGPTFDNARFVAELDPVSASAGSNENALGNLALAYANVPDVKGFESAVYKVDDSEVGFKFMRIPSGFKGSEANIIKLMNQLDATATASGGKFNPKFVTEITGIVGEKQFYIFDTDAIKFGSNITISKGSVITSNNLTQQNGSGESVGANIAHGTQPFAENYGTISNIQFMYQGADNGDVAFTSDSFVLMNKNYGYLYNVAVATKIVKVENSNLTSREVKLTKNTTDNKKFALIGENNGGIYKSGTSIVFSSYSSLKHAQMSFFVFDNFGTIKESYTTSKYNGEFEMDTVEVAFMAFNNNGTIKNCEVAGRYGNILPTSSNVKKRGNSPSNCWICQDGNPAAFTNKGDTLNWNDNKNYILNEGFPYIVGGIKIKSDPYGGKDITVNTVQEFKNFLTYLNAFADPSLNANPNVKGDVNMDGVIEGQTLNFNIQKGEEMADIFYLNNKGTIKGEIVGLTLYNPLVRTNFAKGNIDGLTIKSTTMTSSDNSSALVCAVNNYTGIINNVVVGDGQNASYGCKVNVKNGAVIVAENKGTVGAVKVMNTTLTGDAGKNGYLGGAIGNHSGYLYYDRDQKIEINKNGTNTQTTFSIYTYKLTITGTAGNIGLAIGNIESTAGAIQDEPNNYGSTFEKTMILNQSNITATGVNVGGAVGTTRVDITTTLRLDTVKLNVSAMDVGSSSDKSGVCIGGVIGWLTTELKNSVTIGPVSALSGEVKVAQLADENQVVNVGGLFGEASYLIRYAMNVMRLKMAGEWICTNDVTLSATGCNYYAGGIVGESSTIDRVSRNITYAGTINAVGYRDVDFDPNKELKGQTINDIFGKYGTGYTGGIANMTNTHKADNTTVDKDGKRIQKFYAFYGLDSLKIGYLTGNLSGNDETITTTYDLKIPADNGGTITQKTYNASQKNVADSVFALECQENLVKRRARYYDIDMENTYYTFTSYKFDYKHEQVIPKNSNYKVVGVANSDDTTYAAVTKNILNGTKKAVAYNQKTIDNLWVNKLSLIGIRRYHITNYIGQRDQGNTETGILTFKAERQYQVKYTYNYNGNEINKYQVHFMEYSKDRFGFTLEKGQDITLTLKAYDGYIYYDKAQFIRNYISKSDFFDKYKSYILKTYEYNAKNFKVNTSVCWYLHDGYEYDTQYKKVMDIFKLSAKDWDSSYKATIADWQPFTEMKIEWPIKAEYGASYTK